MQAPRRLQLRRGNTAAVSTYLGAPGELIINTDTNTLYVHNGVTVGGIATTVNTSAITSNISSLQSSVSVLQGNILTLESSITTLTSNAAVQSGLLASLLANAGVQSGDIASLLANAGVQSGELATLTSNAASQSGALADLVANAASQTGTLATLTSNAASQSGALADLVANAAVQAGLIASVTGTYSNANVKTYLSNFDGNLIPSANVTYSLGSITNQWKDLFVSNTTIFMGGVPLSITDGNLSVNGNIIPTISYVDSVASTYSNANVASYLTQGNVTIVNPTLVDNVGSEFQFLNGELHFPGGNGAANYGAYVSGSGSLSVYPTDNSEFMVQTYDTTPGVGSRQWKITAAGNLEIPDDGSIVSDANIRLFATDNIAVATELGGTWLFDTNGNLTFPDSTVFTGSTITTPDSNGGMPKSFKWEFSDITIGSDTVTLEWNLLGSNQSEFYIATGYSTSPKYLLFSGTDKTLSFMSSPGFDDGGKIVFGTAAAGNTGVINDIELKSSNSNVYIRANNNSWQFSNTGTIKLPTLGNIANGGNSWQFNSNGNIILPTNLNFSASPAINTTGIVFGDGSFQNRAWTGTVPYAAVTDTPDAYGNTEVATYLASGSLETAWVHGNLTVGNLTVNGNITYIGTNSYVVTDNIVQFADGNPADTLDLGFVAHRTVGSTLQHTGFVRDASANNWKLFSNITAQPGTTVDFTGVMYDDLVVGNISSPTITNITSNLGAISGSLATLTANAASQAGLITDLQSNAAVQAGDIATLFANAGAQAGSITTLTSNAAVQSGDIATIYANLGGVAGSLATLTANAGAQAGILASLTNYSNSNVASYLTTYSGNIGNVLTTANVVTTQYFIGNGALLTGIVASGSSSNYSNVNVSAYLSGTTAVFTGNTNTLAAIQSNISQVFIGNSTALTSGGGQNTSYTYLLHNLYYDAAGQLRYRNSTSTGAVQMQVTGVGFQLSGQNSTVTANTTASPSLWAAITSSGITTYNSAGITAAGNITTQTGGLLTTQATSWLYNTNATTINMGGAATTIRMGTITSNVFVGGALGNANKELTLRAQGTWNIATSIDSNGGFNSPPYTNQPVIGGSGTGMTANYNATGGYLTSVTIYNPGTGYRSGDVLSVPGGIAGNSFVLTNYSSTKTGNSAAAYTFGIEGNLTAPGNITITSNSSYFIGNALGTTATYTGNVSATYFIGDGSLLTNIASGGGNYSNVNVAVYLGNVSTNINPVPGDIWGLGAENKEWYSAHIKNAYIKETIQAYSGGGYSGGNAGELLKSTGSGIAWQELKTVNGNSLFGNGDITISAGGSTYGDSNVASYLLTYTGNIGNIDLVANLGAVSGSIATLTSNAAIQAGIISNLTNYANANVASYLPTYSGNITATNVTVTGNVTANILVSNTIQGAVTNANTTITAGTYTTTFDTAGNVTAQGNVVANYLFGNGAFLTGVVTSGGSSSNYANANVAVFLSSFGSNAISTTGNVTAAYHVGNLTNAGGNVYTVGNIIVGVSGYTVLPTTVAQFTGNANTYTQLNLQNISTGSDATSEYVATANNGTDTTFFVDMGIANSNYDVNSPNNSLGTTIYPNDSYLYAQGNLATTTGGNLAIGTSTAGKSVKIFAGGINSANIVATVSNTGVAVTGSVSATANVSAVNMTATANVSAVNMTASGNVNVTGYVITSGGYGNISQVDTITANTGVYSGNVTVSGAYGVTMPNRPAFRINGSTQNIPQTLTANVNLKGLAITTVYNQGSHFDSTTGKFTAPVAGIYAVGLNARVGTNNGLNQIAVLKNGLNTAGNVACFWESDTNTGTAVHYGVNGTIILAVGDYLSANILAGNVTFDQNDNWHVTYLG